jgi:CTP:molybdopterin cytidylyltransferase MocA
MQMPLILILAAGGSTRMRGADKLMEPVEGEPLLRRLARQAVQTGCPVLVAHDPARATRAAALEGLALRVVPVPDAAQGMSASLRAGVRAAMERTNAPEAGLMILPADMPEITLDDLAGITAAFRAAPDRILRGVAETGQQGHPAIFPADLWPALLATSGDQGGIAVLRAHPDRIMPFGLPGFAAVTDLDTPEDWAVWRARNPGR